jgi:DNA-binding CsgD family transcriptional regulator
VDGLTSTERRVAGLIAHGQTNREIASAMFVTENTVQTHLRHIFQKLGVRSRTELAAQFLSAAPGMPLISLSSAVPEPGRVADRPGVPSRTSS